MKRIIIITALICACICIRAQWQWQNPLPQGNNLWDVYFINQDMGWALGEKGVIIRTIDGGENWELMANNSEQYLYDIFFIDENTGWLAGHSHELSDGVVLKTTDGGVTWNTCLQVQKSLQSIYFNDADHGWVGSWGFRFNRALIYMTEDGGDNWVVCCDSIGSTVTSFNFVNSDTGFAACGGDGGYIYGTVDGGHSWEINYDNGLSGLSSICFVSIQMGYAAGEYSFLKTIDCGSNWIELNSIYGEVKSISFTDSLNGWATYNAESGFPGFIQTNDGGLSWDYSSNLVGMESVFFIDKFHGWVVGSGGSIYQTDNEGNDWNVQLKGNTSNINSLYFADNQHGWAVGGSSWGIGWGGGSVQGMIMLTVDGGNSWETIIDDTSHYYLGEPYDTLFPLEFNDVYFKSSLEGWIVGGSNLLGDPDGLIMHTIDGGNSWEIQIYDTSHSFNNIHFATGNCGYVIGSMGTVYKTTDSGNQWNIMSNGLYYDLNSIYFVGPTIGWIGDMYGTIYHTEDGGISWNNQFSGPYGPTIGLNFENELEGWFFRNNGDVMFTGDGGENWHQQISGNLYINDICVDEELNFWAVGNSGKLAYSTPNSDEWIILDSKTNNGMNSIYFLNSENGWIGGNGGSILYSSNGGAVNIQESYDNSPFIELKTYPNPFITSTTLSYTLDKASAVTIGFYNPQGQLIEKIEQEQSKGEQQVHWNAERMPAGMYFFRIQAGEMVSGGKMMLMR